MSHILYIFTMSINYNNPLLLLAHYYTVSFNMPASTFTTILSPLLLHLTAFCLTVAFCLSTVTAGPAALQPRSEGTQCESMRYSYLCNEEYTQTSFPNSLGHRNQEVSLCQVAVYGAVLLKIGHRKNGLISNDN